MTYTFNGDNFSFAMVFSEERKEEVYVGEKLAEIGVNSRKYA